MPIISITLPQKEFYIYKEDIVKIDKIADNKIKRDETYHKEDTSYWDQYDPYYKVTEYCFNVSWELLGLIGNRTVKLSNFFSEVEVQKFPYDFYYESTSSDNRSVFLSTWESTINPSLLYDFLERLSQSNLYIQLSGEDKQQVRKLIILCKTMLNYSVRLDLNREL